MSSPTGEDDDLTIEEWLGREMGKMLQELMFIEISYETHLAIWGVPCGPTLAMVHPPEVRGLLDRFNEFDPTLADVVVKYIRLTDEDKAGIERPSASLDELMGLFESTENPSND